MARETAASARRQALIQGLRSCATEADVVQVLYSALHPLFGYDVINLQVLEREGWFHSLAVDQGVLQDVRRRRLEETVLGSLYERGKPEVVHPAAGVGSQRARGPGAGKPVRSIVWMPVENRDELIGSLSYSTYKNRAVPASELAFLEEIHRVIGVLIANASLNDITRNQSVSLAALNTIARALSSTLDEKGVVAALHATLSQLLPVEALEMAALTSDNRVRILRYAAGQAPETTLHAISSAKVLLARKVLESGRSLLEQKEASQLWVPIKEGGAVSGALSIRSSRPDAYEESTITFLEQAADEVALAVRNASSYAALEAQRRRLEVVNAVGRRLASSLDRWSIMRTLREELARHLEFDGFILATISETPSGPVAQGYQYLGGYEEPVPPVPLAVTGPSREAYESGLPVLLRRNPWARSMEARHPAPEQWTVGEGAAFFVSRPARSGRLISRSLVWVPVMHGERITALLSLQSYRADAFDDWHVQLLQDVAAHVSLALANAEHFSAAQAERRRLEALHVIELAVAGSGDERQIAEAVFGASSDYLDASYLILLYLDPGGQLIGFFSEHGAAPTPFGPTAPEKTGYFKRLLETGRSIVEELEPGKGTPGNVWEASDRRLPRHVLWVPVMQGERVAGALSAQRLDDRAFAEADLQLLESAAPVVGIALRTVRLHHANELALGHSVRMQEVAALAGHDLASVVSSVADQARTMLGAAGVACWAFDIEGRISARGASGDVLAEKVLGWAGEGRAWQGPASPPLTGTWQDHDWSLIPLSYADRVVGALGSIHASGHIEEPGSAALEFARHAAIAIENARLVAETRDRIHMLEAVAGFADLDPTQPARARTEMAHLVERALSGSGGALWLLDGEELLRVSPDGSTSHRVPGADPRWLLPALRQPVRTPRLKALVEEMAGSDPFAAPVLVEGRLAGVLVASLGGASAAETRRLVSLLAGQAGVLLGQLELVDALDRERRMMNAILRHSPVGAILEDAQGRIVYANPEVEAIYRVPAAALTGLRPQEIFEKAGAEVSVDSDVDGDTLELRVREPNRIIRVRRVPIPGLEGEPAGVLTMHEDVTHEVLMLEAKDLMLRAIGHEVRSPAAAMKTTLAGLLQWDELIDTPARQALLEEAYESSERLLSLVESQLIIAKLETRHFEPSPEPIPLRRALDQVMNVLRHRYGEGMGLVEVRLRDSLPPAFCEPTHLEQVLTNLIGNALEYARGSVRVTARAAGSWLEVTVSDEGPGLPSDRLDAIFEKTGPAGRNRSRGGLGLGLYLCRLVVERSFGGRIWLASAGRSGTVFKFTVPAVESPASPNGRPAGARPRVAATSRRSPSPA